MIPDLTTAEWTDALLDQLRQAVISEQERRYTLATAAQQAADLASRWEQAAGRADGDGWAQPTGAHDAYRAGATVTYRGKTWVSTVQANVWEPGTSGWREAVPEGAAPAEFRQPTGAHDVYRKGDRVAFKGKIYESVIDANAYSPNDYPAGWKLV